MRFASILLLAALPAAPTAPSVTHYKVSAVLDPAAHTIAVEGTMKSPSSKETPFKSTKAINHPIASEGEDYARGFAETEGTIQAEGVFLSGG
jgi:hypothetical protein